MAMPLSVYLYKQALEWVIVEITMYLCIYTMMTCEIVLAAGKM